MNQGAAYLFDQTGPTSWTQKAELTSSSDGATDGAAGDQFGYSVALTATSAFVGAPGHAVGGEADAGSVYVFTGSGSSWSLSQELTDPADETDDVFGGSMAVSGSTAFIGAVGAADDDGGAYVFGLSGSSWSQSQPILVAGDGADGASFGAALAISGANAFIGATGGGSDEIGATYALNSLSVDPVGAPVTAEALAGWSSSDECGCGSSGSGGGQTVNPSSPVTYHPKSGGRAPYPDTIDPRVGDFYETTTDVSVPGPGVPLQFTRTYDSQVSQTEAPGPLGYGWSDNLGMSLSDESGVATITEEKGTQVAFTSSTAAAWCPSGFNYCEDAPRIDATLEYNSDSSTATWVFTREAAGTTVFTFNSTGALDSIADADGNTLTATSESPGTDACPSSANSCTVWTSSASGRQLTEVFDSSGRLIEVTDGTTDTSNTVTFCYYGEICQTGGSGGSEDLYSATDPGGLTTTYTYDASNSNTSLKHDMLTLTPPGDSGDVVNTYDTSGRISTQENLDGDFLQYCYSGDPSTVEGGVTTVYNFSDSSCAYETGAEVWTYSYSSNVLVAETSGAGTATASTDYYERDPVSLVPHTEVGGNGGSTIQDLNTYDITGGNPISSGDALSSTDAMGNVTQYAYTGDNLPWCTVSPAETAAGAICPLTGEPTSPPSTGDGATIDIYNGYDQLTSSTDPLGNTTLYGYTPGGGSEPAGLQYCTIDPVQYAAGTTCPTYGTTEPGVATKTFDSYGDVLTSTTADGATTTYTYSVPGFQGLVSSETVYPDGGTSSRQGDTTAYTYNPAGQVTSETVTNFDNATDSAGALSATTLSAYDTSGRLFCQVAPDEVAQGVTCPSSAPSSPPTPGHDSYLGATITSYDSLGQVIQTTNPLGGISITVYDQSENAFCTAGPYAVAAFEAEMGHSTDSWPYMCPTSPPSSPPTPSSDPYLGATLTTYDSLGRAIQVTSPTGGITLTAYDADGNVVETQTESNNSTNAPTISTTTAYDADDQAVETTTGSSSTLSYYDPDGNVYCSVSANAYAEGSSYYQCPAWQSSWIKVSGNTSLIPSNLYSTSPDSSQANNVTTNFYNADGSLLQSTNPDVDTSVTAYDPDGRSYCSATPTNVANYLSAHPSATWPYLCPTTPPTSAPSGTPGYTTTIYDTSGDVVSSTDPTGDTTTYTYDDSGDKLSSTDPAGNTTHYCFYYENDPGQCASSANPGSWSGSATLDSGESLNAGSCPTVSFCAVGDQDGKVFTLKAGTWSSATTLDSAVAIKSISCATESFCVAGDADGNAYVYNGSSWSSASSLDSGHTIKSMSCPASNFCAAGDANGEVFSYNGTSWSAATTLDSGQAINALSCATAGFCEAGDAAGNVYKFSGSSWSTAHSLSSHAIESISCTSAVFCAAADFNGKAYIYTGSWSGTIIDSGAAIEQVSCSGSSLCAAVTANGNAYTYNGSSWSAATTLDSGVVINSVSCGSWSTCEATDASGNAYTFENSSWSEPVGASSASLKVTCATQASCLGFDSSGNAYTYHGNTWDAPVQVGTHALDAVSCPSAGTCIAVNVVGKAYAGNGVTWTGNVIDGTTALESIACPSSTFCEIGDASGKVLTYANGGSGWSVSSTSTVVSGQAITSVSCVSSTSCWAGAANGEIYHYNGSTWSSGTTLESGDPVTSISCTPSSFCEAGNSAGNVYSSSSWSTATLLNSGKSIYVSCTSSSFCAAVASRGKAFTYNGTWSSATTTGSSGFDAVSCATSDYCVAVDGTGGAFTYTGSGWSNDADIDGGTALNGISCAQSWDCVAVDASEDEISDLGSGFGTQLDSTTTPATPVDPAGMIATTTYTPGGEALVTTKPSGETIDTYGQMDDLSGVTYTSTAPGYSTPANVSYTYNVDGSQASMTDGTGTTDYTYDGNGDTTEVAFAPGTGTGLSSSTVQYGYYSTGVLDTLTYPSYGSVSDPEATYTYDDQGNMVSMEDWNTKITSFTYDADQNLKSTSFPTANSGGSAVDNTYDPADNLTDTTVVDSEIWTTTPYDEDLTKLTRNPDSLIATSTPAGGSESTLGYDPTDRLQTGLGAEAYTYDPDSRLSTDTPSGGSATDYSYDTGSELCGTETSSSPSCTSPASGTTIYGYDSDGDRCYQATTTSPGSCASPPAGTSLETYGWDQTGDLTCVTVANSASATCASPNTTYTSSYVYNGDGLRVADTPAGGSLQQFTWDPTGSIPRILRDGTNEYLYGSSSLTPIEQINMSTGAASYLVSDNQGVRMGLASSGTSEGTESYNSYGKTTGSTGSPFGFAGGYTDATELLYLVHRYYDPATALFLNVDPLLSVTAEPYAYAADDPTNNLDPSGLGCSSWQWIVAPVLCTLNKFAYGGLPLTGIWCQPSNPPFGETFFGVSGCIAYQTNPQTGATNIGIVMAPWTPSYGFFDYVIGVDGSVLNAQSNLYKWPLVHTTVQSASAPPGSYIEVFAEYITPEEVYVNVPNLYVVPDLSVSDTNLACQ